MITIGVIPNKSSHTTAARDEAEQVLGSLRVPANKATVRTLQRWAEPPSDRTWEYQRLLRLETATPAHRCRPSEVLAMPARNGDHGATVATASTH